LDRRSRKLFKRSWKGGKGLKTWYDPSGKKDFPIIKLNATYLVVPVGENEQKNFCLAKELSKCSCQGLHSVVLEFLLGKNDYLKLPTKEVMLATKKFKRTSGTIQI